MRIDKFLKESRIIKRRAVAKKFGDQDKIYINEKLVKPSYNVNVGDIVSIYFGENLFRFKVLSLNYSLSKDDSKKMYENLN